MSDILDLGGVVVVLKREARFDPGSPYDAEIAATGNLVTIDATTKTTADDPDTAYELARKLYDEVLAASKGHVCPGAVQQIYAISVEDDDGSTTWSGSIRLNLTGWEPA
ncbi:hypothetical protein [Saccharopolyspora sp. NPDC002376]